MHKIDPLAYKVAFKFQPKETKSHKVDKMADNIKSITGISKTMSQAIADAIVRGRDVARLALQKGWPIEDGVVNGPNGDWTVPTVA
jgi:hypothetical protein